MTPERWQRVKDVFAHASALGQEALQSYLDAECKDDSELRAEVVSLLSAHNVTSAVLDQPAAEYVSELSPADTDERWLGRRIGPYEIVAQLGSGGMGQVYRARRADAQYEKEVAIKLVRGGYDTRFVLQRFKAERQILANLDHPNIARLIDGGATEEGLSYLVMELVDGQPIDQYCDSKKLTIEARLRLFCDVCAAVSYAHQRLVVHRDLKPSNILVTAEGVVKLLDFGIAKLVQPTASDSTADATVTLMKIMTPAFSSPEQILGSVITTTSDVYSLGVVLYHLLTHRSPYRTTLTSTQDAIRAVCETEPVKPSVAAEESLTTQSAHAIPDRDLDDITLKALRKEPEKRYSSVEQLADDIQRYLHGSPVIAHGDRFSYRAGKFARRHKLEIAAAALIVLTLVGAVIISTHEAGIARRQAEIARAERARAEKRFNDVRQLSDSLIFDIHDAIQNLPGATPARKLLLDKAVDYLDSVAKDSGGDPDLQRELAWGYQRLAVVQGSTAESNLGDQDAAIASDRKALANFEAVAKANAHDTIDQLNVAMMHRILSYSLLTDISGRQHLDQAMQITARLLAQDAANPKVRSERSIEFQNLALMQEAAGDRAQALESYRKDQSLKLDLFRTTPEYHGIRRSLGMVAVMLGGALARVGSHQEALQAVQQGIGFYESLPSGADQINVQRELAISKQKRGDILLTEGSIADAQANYREARNALESIAKADPQNVMLRLDLAGVDFNDARILALASRYSESVAKLEKSLAVLQSLRVAERSAEDSPHGVGAIYIWLGDVYAGQGNLQRALQSYRQAIAALGEGTKLPIDDDSRCELAFGYTRSASILLKRGNLQDASAAIEKALQIVNLSVARDNQDVPALYVIADAYSKLGDVVNAQANKTQEPSRRTQLVESARTAHEKSLEIWKQIPNPTRISPNGFVVDDPELTAALGTAHPKPANR